MSNDTELIRTSTLAQKATGAQNCMFMHAGTSSIPAAIQDLPFHVEPHRIETRKNGDASTDPQLGGTTVKDFTQNGSSYTKMG
mmetsp:Transcript_14420/g.22015  ORF Transcript_14420/g.22015 Transcript_14420/m.22015 type:complete len:83 (-) Transcript_14420:31-279(-)